MLTIKCTKVMQYLIVLFSSGCTIEIIIPRLSFIAIKSNFSNPNAVTIIVQQWMVISPDQESPPLFVPICLLIRSHASTLYYQWPAVDIVHHDNRIRGRRQRVVQSSLVNYGAVKCTRAVIPIIFAACVRRGGRKRVMKRSLIWLVNHIIRTLTD